MMQNALVLLVPDAILAACYAALVLLMVHSPARRKMRLWLACCVFSCLYNLVFRDLAYSRAITAVATLAALLPPLESVWRAVGQSRECRRAILALAVSLSYPILFAGGYIAVRSLMLAAVARVCAAAWFALPHGGLLARHLGLQAIWTVDHALFSGTAGWYCATWPRYHAANWAYAASVVAIVLAYQHWFTGPRGFGAARRRPY